VEEKPWGMSFPFVKGFQTTNPTPGTLEPKSPTVKVPLTVVENFFEGRAKRSGIHGYTPESRVVHGSRTAEA
jgi:hypothetical protein